MTPPTPHRCAAVGCQHAVQPGFLMCMDHWRQVPKVCQRDVWFWYRALGRKPEARDRYAQAVQAAVDAVHGKQVARKVAHDQKTKPLF